MHAHQQNIQFVSRVRSKVDRKKYMYRRTVYFFSKYTNILYTCFQGLITQSSVMKTCILLSKTKKFNNSIKNCAVTKKGVTLYF